MKFRPEDFDFYNDEGRVPTPRMCADIANTILKEWLEEAPVVYAGPGDEWREDVQMHSCCEELLTRKARLVCVEAK